MAVDEFNDICVQWQNHVDALSDANFMFPGEHSSGEIFLDDFLGIEEDIAVVPWVGSTASNVVPSLLSRTEPVPSDPIWSASGFQAVIPPTCDVVLQPSSISSNSRASVTCVSGSELWGQEGYCVREETECPSGKVRKKQAARVASRVSWKKIKTNGCQKRVAQLHSNESARLPTTEEHNLRERKRRDDMAEKFLLLEKFLPPQARRQKAEIMEDAIKLVKGLQLRKDELLKRRAQMKLMLLNPNKAERSLQYPSCQSKRYPSQKKSAIDMQFAASLNPQLIQVTPSSTSDRKKAIDTGIPTIMGHSPHYPIAGATVDNMTPLRIDTNSCRELLQIHAQVSDEEILVEMLFRQYSPNLQTRVMQTVEAMKLEVIHGSMQRSVPCGFIQYIITAKSRVACLSSRQDTQSSARLLVGTLHAAFSESARARTDRGSDREVPCACVGHKF